MPVSYDGNSVLECQVTIAYDRYYFGKIGSLDRRVFNSAFKDVNSGETPGSSSEKKVGINKGNGDKNAAKIIDPIKPTEQVVTSEAEGSIGANDLNDISSNIA